MSEYDLLKTTIENFIQVHSLDARAADALMSCAPEVQQRVLDRGDMRDVRNPSSAVLGRIRDAQIGMISHAGPGRPSPVLQMSVEEFVSKFSLDDRAAGALRDCPGEVQQAVIDRGDLADVRNPSSAVIGRIRDAQSGGATAAKGGGCAGKGGACMGWAGPPAAFGSWGPSMGGGCAAWGGASFGGPSCGGGQQGDVEEFIRSNELDERAGDALRSCAPAVQRIVIDRGSLRETRNPSSAALGRIRDAESDGVAGKGGANGGAGAWGCSPQAWAAGPFGALGGSFGPGKGGYEKGSFQTSLYGGKGGPYGSWGGDYGKGKGGW